MTDVREFIGVVIPALFSRKPVLISLILIAVVSLLSYSNTFDVPFQLDDTFNISDKPYVRDINSFLDPVKIEYLRADGPYRMRTVTYLSLAVNYLIHGTDVLGYHIVNLAIHIFNGFLVYFLVLLTLRTPYFGSEKSKVKSEKFFALACALLFVSHPIQTQAVTYIVQRTASLAALFYLLSLVMYIKWRISIQGTVGAYRDTPAHEATPGVPVVPDWRSMGWYLLSLLSAVLAMKTKEIAFTLPLVIVLCEFMFFGGPVRKRVLYLLPLMLTLLIIPLELMGLGKQAGEVIGDVTQATRVQTDLSRWEYLFTQFRVIVTYIRLLFFPVNQNLDYDYPVYDSFFDPNVFMSFLFLLAIFGIGVYCLYRSRIDSRGNHRGIAPTNTLISQPSTFNLQPSFRLISFGIFWFFITLSVESSVIPITDVIFEHRLYLPSIGFFIAVTAVLFLLWQHFNGGISPSFSPRRTRLCAGEKRGVGRFSEESRASTGSSEKEVWKLPATIAVGVFGLILVILSVTTYARNNLWKDEVRLWEDVVGKSPMKVRPHSNLGHFYGKQGRFEEAIREYRIALSFDPDDFQVHNNLGVIYKAQGRIGEALREYQTALRLAPEDAFAYYNLGNIFREQGNFEEAIRHYQAALRLEPPVEVAVIHNNLGIAYIGRGSLKEAEREFRMALDFDPGYEPARRNLDILLGGGGRQ